MRKLWLTVVASCVFFVPFRAQASCHGDTSGYPPDGTVCGDVFRQGFNGYYYYSKAADVSYVKICPADYYPFSASCSTVQTSTKQDGYYNPVQAFIFPRFRENATSSADFDLYAWSASSNDPWGSSDKPIRRISVDRYGLVDMSVYMPPRPLDPTPLYPSGSAVGSSYTVRWNSGIDTDRSPYPVNYEVWYKYWPFGGTEPAGYSLSRANMPCHDNGTGPDAYNECSTYVAGPQPAGNWKWYVVANLNVSSAVYYGFPNTFFTTQSNGLYFTEP